MNTRMVGEILTPTKSDLMEFVAYFGSKPLLFFVENGCLLMATDLERRVKVGEQRDFERLFIITPSPNSNPNGFDVESFDLYLKQVISTFNLVAGDYWTQSLEELKGDEGAIAKLSEDLVSELIIFISEWSMELPWPDHQEAVKFLNQKNKERALF